MTPMAQTYIPELYSFLSELASRQDREWFRANRPRYDMLRQAWLDDLQRLITHVSEWWPEMRGLTAKSAAFRIYRDTRFSTDKSPYKSYFSASLSPRGHGAGGAHRPGFYLQMGPDGFADGSGLYGGVWAPASPVLAKLRKAIVDNIEEFEEIISEPRLVELYPDWCASSSLKTVPKGYDRNHPQAHLLRLCDYGRWLPCDMAYFDDPAWPEKAARDLRPLKPLIDFLAYSIDEE